MILYVFIHLILHVMATLIANKTPLDAVVLPMFGLLSTFPFLKNSFHPLICDKKNKQSIQRVWASLLIRCIMYVSCSHLIFHPSNFRGWSRLIRGCHSISFQYFIFYRMLKTQNNKINVFL